MSKYAISCFLNIFQLSSLCHKNFKTLSQKCIPKLPFIQKNGKIFSNLFQCQSFEYCLASDKNINEIDYELCEMFKEFTQNNGVTYYNRFKKIQPWYDKVREKSHFKC